MTEVDSDEDLTKELQPLAYHVSDRKRVLTEAFRALKGKRLEAMIPPTLKAWNRPKLESACLSILEDLDDETLLAILDGRLRTAGVTAVEHFEQPASPETDSNVKVKNSKKKQSKTVAAEEMDEPKKKKKKKVIISDEDTLKALKLKKKKKLAKERMKEKLKKKKKAAAAAATPESAPAPHKSLMELLELEYRAKAIKALLRSQGQSVPDIPINIEGEDEPQSETPPTEATPLPPATTATAASQTNGTDSKSKGTSSAQTKSGLSPQKKSKPTSKPKREVNTENSNVKPGTDSSRNEPQKEVVDLIDEALNIQVAEGLATENDKPSSVIAEACATKSSDTEESLRSKLLRKYQQQQQQPPEEKEEVVQKPKKKRKKRPPPDQNNDNEEDILDLHPRELNLSDEDHNQTSENDSSEYETDSESIPIAATTPNTKESAEADNDKEIVRSKANDEEELLYDDDDNDSDDDNDEIDGNQNDSKNPDRVSVDDEGNSNQSDKDSEENENKLWEDVQDVSSATREADVPDLQNEETLPNESQESGREDEPPKENSQSEMACEKTRDDVFENMSGQATSKSSAFPGQSQGGLKRRITFRIDPARIGALEEQAVEEEARREAERKKEEEEEEKERLAKQMEAEVEEGEIDSNEEETEIGNSPSSSPRKSERNYSPERESRWNKNNRAKEDTDSADSQDSASGYSTRRPYRRKSSPKRDFGRYSPKKLETSGKEEEESPEKRPNSPVEFITQFSDMEPISDEDSNEGSQTSSKRRKKVKSNLPVQGCASKPAEDQTESETDLVKDEDSKEDLENKERDNESEEEEEDLPKPVTWYERWAESHGMQKVVKTNKIHRKVRSKMKQVKTAKQKQPEVPKVPEPSIEAEPIIGSIEEYEKLFGKKVINKEPEKSHQADDTTSNDKGVAEEENDDDADDLWGDIIGDS